MGGFGVTRRAFVRTLAVVALCGAEILQVPGRPSELRRQLTHQEKLAMILERALEDFIYGMDPVWKEIPGAGSWGPIKPQIRLRGASRGVTGRDG
jgi:hypothetical protein